MSRERSRATSFEILKEPLGAYVASRSKRCKWWALEDKEMIFPDTFFF